MTLSKSAKIMMAIGACIGWFALIIQFYLILQNRQASVPETIIRFFSFFTILSNIIVATCFTVQLISPSIYAGSFWSSVKTQTAIAVYILVVGLVYNAVLRFLWAPIGLQKLVDELLHTIIPSLFLLYWILFAPKQGMQWRYILSWLLFPFIYLVYTFARGALTNYYPYPFLDAYNNGYLKVFISSAVILTLFLLLSLLFIAAGKIAGRKNITVKVEV